MDDSYENKNLNHSPVGSQLPDEAEPQEGRDVPHHLDRVDSPFPLVKPWP